MHLMQAMVCRRAHMHGSGTATHDLPRRPPSAAADPSSLSLPAAGTGALPAHDGILVFLTKPRVARHLRQGCNAGEGNTRHVRLSAAGLTAASHTCHHSWTAEKGTVASREAPVGSSMAECGRLAARSPGFICSGVRCAAATPAMSMPTQAGSESVSKPVRAERRGLEWDHPLTPSRLLPIAATSPSSFA